MGCETWGILYEPGNQRGQITVWPDNDRAAVMVTGMRRRAQSRWTAAAWWTTTVRLRRATSTVARLTNGRDDSRTSDGEVGSKRWFSKGEIWNNHVADSRNRVLTTAEYVVY